MAQSVIQHSFNSGEWSPALNARVDLAKYHSGAALLRNFFVDYRGGASTRPGTKYVLQALRSNTNIRIVGFQASTTVGYILEFGDFYIRFYFNGAAVLEPTFAITGATAANPAVLTIPGNNYNVGDWFYVTGVLGMTQLNGRYFKASAVAGASVTLSNLNGAAINSTGYSAYTGGGTAGRVYTLPSPFVSADLSTLKFAININSMIITHLNYPPYRLILISAANWTLSPTVFGSSISAPTGVGSTTTLAAGNVNYAYVVTAVDVNFQESNASTPTVLANKQDLRTVAGTNSITWTARTGALFYNVYKAELSYTGAVPGGAAFGFIGYTTGLQLDDSNIPPDFSETPPITNNPFQGASVAFIAVTAPGVYTSVPTITVAAPASGQTATATAVLGAQSIAIVSSSVGNAVGAVLSFPNGVQAVVATVDGFGQILTFQPFTFPGSSRGAISAGATPANPVSDLSGLVTVNLTWGVTVAILTYPGSAYSSAPAVTPSSGAATFAASLGAISLSNPSVPAYFSQRLVLAAPTNSPQTFYMSKPGSYFNFDISNPTQSDDSITGTLVSNQLNTIKSMLPMPSGLVIFSDRQAWLVNGGGGTQPITPENANAQSQAYNGASDVPPILATYDILYVQAKGSSVRDLSYNFYTNIYTGTDISVISSHLFYSYTITGWAFAEEPFKVVWAVRSDGTLLSLTFMKEQELIAWAHSDTLGSFKSVATVVEAVASGSVDAIYVVVQRTINGMTIQYIERLAERTFTAGISDAWCVDAGLQYSGAPITSFQGAEHLAGATVTGLADGVEITPFVMPTTGFFTLPSAASKVTIGLAFTPQLQTLQLDIGEPTIQGKRKKIAAVTVRCQDTLGLSIGKTFSTLVPMKDLVVGNVGSATNSVVAGLVTGDARTILDPSWDVPGQYCIQQSHPFPATILGVIPEIVVGDTAK